jgi:hypothetical protein
MDLYTCLRSSAAGRDRIGRASNGLAEIPAVPRAPSPSRYSFQIVIYPPTQSHERGGYGAALAA